MTGLDKKQKAEATSDVKKKPNQGYRADVEELDDQETLFAYLEEHKDDAPPDDNDDEYDEDGNIIPKQQFFELLPLIDHASVDYPPFNKDFYEEHSDITKLNNEEVRALSMGCLMCSVFHLKL